MLYAANLWGGQVTRLDLDVAAKTWELQLSGAADKSNKRPCAHRHPMSTLPRPPNAKRLCSTKPKRPILSIRLSLG